MIEPDTIRLLRECDAGIRMGVSAIDDVIGRVTDDRLSRRLAVCKNEPRQLSSELQTQLDRFGDGGKRPSAMASAMSSLKTNVKLTLHPGDSTVADLMTDGCNMGVKSLSRYLNEYGAADERAKDAAKKLIAIEENLSADLRRYL